MDPQGSRSRAYRTPTVNDGSDDEDDLDDLDDVLTGFNQPKVNVPSSSTPAPPLPSNGSRPLNVSDDADDGGDFEASLAGEMELLLRQLAGTHIPGPMLDDEGGLPAEGIAPPRAEGQRKGGDKALSAEDEEAEFQKAIEMMLSGEGLAALGLDGKGDGAGSSTSRAPPSAPSSSDPKPSFDETIRRTMEQLGSKDKGRSGAGMAGGAGDGIPPDLAALLAKLGDGDGLDDGDDDDQLKGLLDGMMSQLMTKEVLEEPMSDLASKYPAYLASPPAGVSEADLQKYRQQHKIVEKIVAIFRKSDYSADDDGAEIARLVGEMQDLGGPPKEIIGDLPEGLDLGGMGGDDSCVIM